MTKHQVTIFHYKSCSTSQKVLDWLLQNEFDVQVFEYQKTLISKSQLLEIVEKSGRPISYFLRKKDKVFQELYKDQECSQDAWMEHIIKHPSILERPILVFENNAFLARPYQDFIDCFSENLLK
jgi:arsenate reductase